MFRRNRKAEKVLLFSLHNDRTEKLTVTIEPLARVIELAPGEKADVFDPIGDDAYPAELVATDHGLSVHLNFEGFVRHKGGVTPNHPYDSDDDERLRRLKAVMADTFSTRGILKKRAKASLD